MGAASDVPDEARDVVGKMVGAVRAFDPGFFDEIGEGELAASELPENRVAPLPADAAWIEAFDKSLDGRSARLIDYGVNGPGSVASAVRHTLARPDLSDADALALVLDPARNRYRLDTLNVGVHAPLMRALNHAHYTFRKKLSHTADSQDQRHRMVPGSRPLLTRSVPRSVDVVVPELIAGDAGCLGVFRECVEAQWHARARLLALGVAPSLALYVLPNAVAVRFEESGSLLHLLHKWTMRTCLNAQREIYEASMDEIAQVRAVHPELMRFVGPPCSVRNGLVSPRCTEGDHFCGVPVWKSFPNVARRI
jgi:hypothetical protein